MEMSDRAPISRIKRAKRKDDVLSAIGSATPPLSRQKSNDLKSPFFVRTPELASAALQDWRHSVPRTEDEWRDRTRMVIILKGGAVVKRAAAAVDVCRPGRRVQTQVTDDPSIERKKQAQDVLGALHKSGFTWTCETHSTRGPEKEKVFRVVVIVDCGEERLFAEHKKAQDEAWLKAGGMGMPPSENFTIGDKENFRLPAYKLELMDRILHSPILEGGSGIPRNLNSVKPTDRNSVVESVFPLHDDRANRRMLARWLKPSCENLCQTQTLQTVDTLRNILGEHTGFYFAFEDHYIKWLAIPSVGGIAVGLIQLVSEGGYYMASALWSLVVCGIWAPLFLEFWKRQQNSLGLKWGVRHFQEVMYPNPDFSGTEFRDEVTGETVVFFPLWEKRARKCVIWVCLFLTVVVLLVVSVILSDVYLFIKQQKTLSAFEMWLLVVCLGIAWGIIIDILLWNVFQPICVLLNNFENHSSMPGYNRGYNMKVFVWYYFGMFTYFWVISFVYVPFGHFWTTSGFYRAVIPYANSVRYEDNLINLGEAFVTPLVVTQLLSLLLEAIVPFIVSRAKYRAMRKARDFESKLTAFPKGVTRQSSGSTLIKHAISNAFRTNSDVGSVASSSRSAGLVRNLRTFTASGSDVLVERIEDEMFTPSGLDRILEQSSQAEYKPVWDYADMMMQFGYTTMFSGVWPFIAVCALLNNVLEIRSDAFKAVTLCRRPVPRKTKDIGTWYNCMKFTIYVSYIVNVSLIALSTGQLEWFWGCPRESPKHGKLTRSMGPNFECIGLTNRLWFAIVAEHVLVGLAIVITTLVPDLPSEVEQRIRTSEKDFKARYMMQLQKQREATLTGTPNTRRGVSRAMDDFSDKWESRIAGCIYKASHDDFDENEDGTPKSDDGSVCGRSRSSIPEIRLEIGGEDSGYEDLPGTSASSSPKNFGHSGSNSGTDAASAVLQHVSTAPTWVLPPGLQSPVHASAGTSANASESASASASVSASASRNGSPGNTPPTESRV